MSASNVHDPITVSIGPVGRIEQLKGEWTDLETKASGSFFQSWFWIETWLRHAQTDMRLIRMFQGDRLVALGILAASVAKRPIGGLMPILGLNEAPVTDLSKISIEYNGFLCETGLEDRVHQQFVLFLEQEQSELPNWRECRLPGCGPGLFKAAQQQANQQRLYRQNPAPYLELQGAFEDMEVYLSILSKNTRQQLRRSLRIYEEAGPLSVSRPDDIKSAEHVMNRLIDLHQAQWQARGKPGAFSNQSFCDFHFDLMNTHFEAGIIDLVEVKAGEQVIGILYNFVYGETVSSYQSGFLYEADNRLKPGLVCHALAISDYAAKGMVIYRFLAGDQRYKKSLSTGADELYWIAIQRPDLRMHLENAIRSIKARF